MNRPYDFQFSRRQLWTGSNTSPDDLLAEIPASVKKQFFQSQQGSDINPELADENQKWLQQISYELEHGRGAIRMRLGSAFSDQRSGADEHMPDQFLNFARQFGTPVSQSRTGQIVLAVENHGYTRDDPRFRGPFSQLGTTFHSDRCDVIAFLCIRPAKTGGANRVVNTRAIHEELAREHPELLEVLYEDFLYKRHTVDSGNSWPFCQQPIFANVDGRFVSYLMRILINRAYASDATPDMTTKQKQALDLVEQIARRPDFHVEFTQQPGDILMVNNFITLHARDRFEDDPENPRKLLRIWLSTPNSRRLPDSFKVQLGAVAPGVTRGGIHPAK